MLENATKAKLAAGAAVFGCFTRYRDPAFAELIALQGWDFVVFDGEHGILEPHHIEDLCRAVEVRGATPVGRVPTNQPHVILRFLDTGLHGVHIPWVNTPAEAEAAVRSVKYWPEGRRGLAGNRASDWGSAEPLDEYTRRANRETLVVIHIETIDAVETIEDYVGIEGVDVLFIGPTDLSHSLGHAGHVGHPEVVAAMERVAEVVVPSRVTLGIYAGTAEFATGWLERGARYLTTGPDGFLRAGMAAYLDRVRGTA